jgi:hypothetical protein
MGAEVLISLLLGLLDRASQIGTLISTARGEGRDITSAELDALVAQDKAARDELVAAIEKAKAAAKP